MVSFPYPPFNINGLLKQSLRRIGTNSGPFSPRPFFESVCFAVIMSLPWRIVFSVSTIWCKVFKAHECAVEGQKEFSLGSIPLLRKVRSDLVRLLFVRHVQD